MKSEIISIRELRAQRDPDYYIRMVSPEAMAERIAARRQMDRDAENQRRRAEASRAAELRQADLATLLLKVALGSAAIGWLAAVMGMA